MIKQRALLITGLSLLVATVSVAWLHRDQAADLNTPAHAAISASAPVHESPPLAAARPDIVLPPLPPELRGLEPDVRLITDADGNLVPTRDLRVLLDFYLANLDQEPLGTALDRIRATLGKQLEEPALGQALALLERYLGYGMALEKIQNTLPDGKTASGFDLEALQQRQEQMEQLQHAHFDREEKTAFFGDDAELDRYTLARLAVEQNPSLTAVQKQQQLEQLTQQLPETVRVARKRAVIHGEVYQQAEALKASRASDAELYQLRAEKLGENAALELAQLDQQQQAWQNRLTDYQEQKSRIAKAGLSETDRANAITRLREQMFSGPEQLRVRALDGDWH